MDTQDLIEKGAIGVVFTAIGAVATALVRVWRKPSAPAEMIEAAGQVARDMMGELRSELGRITKRVEDLEEENLQCRGENRQLWSYTIGLERILRDAGIPIPAREMPNTLTVFEGEHMTVLKPQHKS